MDERDESQGGFGTGLRAALARARDRAPDEPGVEPEEALVTSPELALVTPELRPGAATTAASPRIRDVASAAESA